MRRTDRRALMGAGLLIFTPTPGRPAAIGRVALPPQEATQADGLPVAALRDWLRPRPGETPEQRVRRLQPRLAALATYDLPPAAAAAVSAARRAADFADEWDDAARVIMRTLEALAENPGEFSEAGWRSTRATLVLAWWASRGQSSRNAAETLQAYLRALIVRGAAPESEYQGLAIRAALEAARRMKTSRGENWVLRRVLWVLGREPGPVELAAFLRAGLHAAGGLNPNQRLFVLEGFALRLLRGELLEPGWARELAEELRRGEVAGSRQVAADHLARWFEEAALRAAEAEEA